MSNTAYILIDNFKSSLPILAFKQFNIIKIDNSNIEDYRDIVYYAHVLLGQYVIEVPHCGKTPISDQASLNSNECLENDTLNSEDLLLLLRLYKEGDLIFIAHQKTNENESIVMLPYPMVFAHPFPPFTYYCLDMADIPKLNMFFAEVPTWQGWKSPWFNIAKHYFLWGGSKEFIPGCNNERILDYMIVLEAMLICEKHFVSRRLKERAAKMLNDKGILKLLNKFYDFRSRLAHGNNLSPKDIQYINTNRDEFENAVRYLFKKSLQCCPAEKKRREEYLKDLYDIADIDRGKKLITDFDSIKDSNIKKGVIKKLKASV